MRALLFAMLITGYSQALLAQAEAPKPTYDFSLPPEAKVKLAESAAPAEISGKATIYLLEKTGYVKFREGTNGFTCLVDRQTPINLEPTCFDVEGSATTVPVRVYVEEQRAHGKSEQEINAALEEGYKSGKFRAPQKPGIAYMMSTEGHILISSLNKVVPVPPHLMFYAPYATQKDIGSPPAAANMPRVIHEGKPEAYIVVAPAPASH